MLVMPPPAIRFLDWTVTPTSKVENCRMAHDRHAHRLGEFPAAESARRRIFRDASVDEPVVGGDGGALLLKGERGAHRFVATGFNPFPYLGKRICRCRC